MRKFVEAGGTYPSDEDQRIIALDMLPVDLPYSFISGLRAINTYDELRNRLECECEYLPGSAVGGGGGGSGCV